MTSEPKSDRIGNDYREGPNPAPGGEVDLTDRAIPPYDGRTTADGNDRASRESVERQLAESDPGNVGATASPAVESPAQPDEVTDREPETPLGVGESVGTRGEDHAKKRQEPGREDTGRQGAERQTGTSSERDRTGF